MRLEDHAAAMTGSPLKETRLTGEPLIARPARAKLWLAAFLPERDLGFSLALHAAVLLGLGFSTHNLPSEGRLLTYQLIMVPSGSRPEPATPAPVSTPDQSRPAPAEVDHPPPPTPLTTPQPEHPAVPPMPPPPGPEPLTAPAPPPPSPEPLTAPATPAPPRSPHPPFADKTAAAPHPVQTRPSVHAQPRPNRSPPVASHSTQSATSPKPQTANPAAPGRFARLDPDWLGRVSQWLLAHRSYPESARREGRQGTVVIRFDVDRNGHVLSASLIQGSGSMLLDKAALALVHDARLPPFPPDMPAPQEVIAAPIRYQLE